MLLLFFSFCRLTTSIQEAKNFGKDYDRKNERERVLGYF
jgi:hypothetical protein